MSQFAGLSEGTLDVAFALIEAYKEDPSPCKFDLTPGFYPMAKQALLSDPTADHEHLPILGHAGLLDSAQRLVFGATAEEVKTIASIQTIAGTGANHLGALLLTKSSCPRTVWISDPTWINHHEIWRLLDSGIKRQTYPYFDNKSFTIDYNGIISTLQLKATEGDVVVLHGCAHNPTGHDFTKDQWKAIANVWEQKKLVPFFDLAYQDFATGDLAEDVWSVRHFFRNASLEILVAQSFPQNFGLYGERVGALHVVCRTEVTRLKVHNMLTRLSRAEITTSPINGARTMAKVLGDKDLKQQWQNDLFHMSDRMRSMRERLVNALQKRQTPGSWDHILMDIGMFSMTCLQPGQIRALKEEYHVYLLPLGRISTTGCSLFHTVIVAAKPE
ncbi:PLP-dependent transferase [Aspergillus alliaceus]|uniref:PLP-dependent transferase n=1 Tax=Petromyces alliaceus TaxID=209559 RepID=UPI0012A5CDC6|nr:PLP-dependent transferase [Aspergillus alliaceus]KAB8239043.1 PLP-dependent transferase [Aspergillus alliaceus]